MNLTDTAFGALNLNWALEVTLAEAAFSQAKVLPPEGTLVTFPGSSSYQMVSNGTLLTFPDLETLEYMKGRNATKIAKVLGYPIQQRDIFKRGANIISILPVHGHVVRPTGTTGMTPPPPDLSTGTSTAVTTELVVAVNATNSSK